MFPDSKLQEKIDEYSADIVKSYSVKNTPFFDFEKLRIKLINGNPANADEIEAVKQWMVLFVTTPRGVYKIYNGTNFGASVRKLYGLKMLNNGYEESELEREIREGFPLCPAIDRVTDFKLSKNGRFLMIYVRVELYNGDLIDKTIEIDTYEIK